MKEFIKAAEKGDLDSIKYYVQKGIDINNARDENGWTALHQAASCDQVAVIKFLISHGANIQVENLNNHNTGWTPLHNAAWNGRKAAISALLEAGANPEAKARGAYNGQTPAQIAIVAKQTNIPDFIKSELEKIKNVKKQQLQNNSFFSKNNEVKIRIWRSEKNGGYGVGHVSLETPKKYISLWPKPGYDAKVTGVVPHTFHTYQEDKRDEGSWLGPGKEREPEAVYSLYTLNAELIDRMFKGYEELALIDGWTLPGGNRLLNGKKGQSCSGLVYDLLLIGGIEKLAEVKSMKGIMNEIFSNQNIMQFVVSKISPNKGSSELKEYQRAQFFYEMAKKLYNHLYKDFWGTARDFVVTTPHSVELLVQAAVKAEREKIPSQALDFSYN